MMCVPGWQTVAATLVSNVSSFWYGGSHHILAMAKTPGRSTVSRTLERAECGLQRGSGTR